MEGQEKAGAGQAVNRNMTARCADRITNPSGLASPMPEQGLENGMENFSG
jgi:hypothetical protein